jgi:hypothetical protein
MAGSESPTLWKWMLRGVVPGLVCNVLGVLSRLGGDEIKLPVLFAMLAAPLFALVYLIVLGKRYVAEGLGKSVVLFVLGYGILNGFLWGAGCALLLYDD